MEGRVDEQVEAARFFAVTDEGRKGVFHRSGGGVSGLVRNKRG